MMLLLLDGWMMMLLLMMMHMVVDGVMGGAYWPHESCDVAVIIPQVWAVTTRVEVEMIQQIDLVLLWPCFQWGLD